MLKFSILLSFIALFSVFEFHARAQKNQDSLNPPVIKTIPRNQVNIPNNNVNPKIVIPKKPDSNRPSNNPNSNNPGGRVNSLAVPPPPPPPPPPPRPKDPTFPQNPRDPGNNNPNPQIPRTPPVVNEIDQPEIVIPENVPEINGIPSVEEPGPETVVNPGRAPVIVPEFDADDYLTPVYKDKMVENLSENEGDYVPNQVLVLIDGVESKNEIISGIESGFNLDESGIHPLLSIDKTLVVFNIPENQNLRSIIKKISTSPGVILAQPNHYFYTMGNETLQYGVQKIKADVAHESTTGEGIKVAVIDTGIDFNHEALADKIVAKKDFINDDGTGFTGDPHGTSVAGIIASGSGKSGKMIGVAPDVKIVAAKACWYDRGKSSVTCTSEKIAKAIDYSVMNKANIINFSLGGPQDLLLSLLINNAIKDGTVVVAASGNGGPGSRPVYPAAMDKVIAVSATDSRDMLYKFSTTGEYVDLSAPGVEILSPAPGNKWHFQSGTSMAAAHVTGAVALLMQKYPELSTFQIRFILGKTSFDLGEPGKDIKFGEGRIDVAGALQELDLNY